MDEDNLTPTAKFFAFLMVLAISFALMAAIVLGALWMIGVDPVKLRESIHGLARSYQEVLAEGRRRRL